MRRAIATLAFLVAATWTVGAEAAKTCRDFTDPAELAQWQVENLIVIGPQGANGGVTLFQTTGAQPARVTSPELNYMTLPDQIWYLCHAIYYLSPTYRGDLTIRWEARLQGEDQFRHFIDVDSLVGAIDPGECQLTFDISVFLEEGGIPAGSVIDQVRFTVLNAPRDVTFGLSAFCFADPDYNYRGLHAHDPTEVPWCGDVCYDGNNCAPGQEPECVEPSDCPAGEVCVGGRCNQPCEAQSDCRGEGFVCIPTGNYCAPPCETNLDCLQTEICVRDNPGGAVCLPRGPDGGFPGGSGSNPPGGGLGDGAPCQGDSQCASRRCESGRCVGDTPPGGTTNPPGGGGGGGGAGTPGFPANYPCQGDTQCASRRCEAGRCTAPTGSPNPVCESDSQCGSGRICLYRQCFVPPGSVCQGDTSCAFGQRCLNGRCTTPTGANPICVGDADCQYGTLCIDGQCVVEPGTECVGDTSCSFGQRCLNGRCGEPTFEAPCPGGNGECGSGLVCTAGFCQAPPGIACTGDAQCGGLQCLNGRCQVGQGEECQGDTQCSNGRRCVSGRCTAPLPPGNFCEEDTQCPVGSYCIGQLCQRPCIYDSHCIGEDQCVGGYCEPPTVCVDEGGNTVAPTNEPNAGGDAVCGPLGCVVNGEPTGAGRIGGGGSGSSACDEDQVCEGGACKPKPRFCVSSNECNPGDVCGGADVCENVAGACEANEDCPVGDVCNGGWCGSSCVTFQGDGQRVTFGCAPGQLCENGTCTDACDTDADCAVGFACADGGYCAPTLAERQEEVRPGGNRSNSTGGGCSMAGGSPTASLPWMLLLGAFLIVSRRRRRS